MWLEIATSAPNRISTLYQYLFIVVLYLFNKSTITHVTEKILLHVNVINKSLSVSENSQASSTCILKNFKALKQLKDFRNGGFIQGIRDWFYNLGNQFHERLFGLTTTPPPPLTIEISNLDKFELQNIIKNHEWHLLNLSILSFDPNQDWGFHVGDWYFIQKGFNLNGFEENSDKLNFHTLSTASPKDSIETETEQTLDVMKDPETTESSQTISSVGTPTTHFINSQTTPTIEQIGSSKNFLPKVDKSLQENETENDFVHKGSVEVLMG
ncbi:unnamed protein product [Heterotrigona itama]|uniref:Uncharacterized protein n=1 Tax=Heterotrigona itama TaxID=395501 RepID=A0A6V7GWZ2_9HYME|nr:unnamed protein product [Heterotrigona itama]